MSEFLRFKGLQNETPGAKKDGIPMEALKNGQRTLVIERQILSTARSLQYFHFSQLICEGFLIVT